MVLSLAALGLTCIVLTFTPKIYVAILGGSTLRSPCSAGPLQIDTPVHGFGTDPDFAVLTCLQAKSIQAAFTLIVGSSTQVLLAWARYQILGLVVLKMAQEHDLSLDLYSALALFPLH